MANFNDAIKPVLEAEGGYINHPNDRGGATNFGITRATLANWLKKPVSDQDVKNLTQKEAEDIYKANYWNPIKGDEIKSQTVANILFDQAVNRGPSAAVKAMQKVLKVGQDGVVGPATLKAMNDKDDKKLALEYVMDAQINYARIVKRNPSQAVFIEGWLNRTHKLLKMIV
jgi:lysozyme family protein